jgi:hypothetical protein
VRLWGAQQFFKDIKTNFFKLGLSRLSLTVRSLRCQIIQFSRVIFKSRPNCLGSLGVRLLGRGRLRTSACFYYPIKVLSILEMDPLLVGVVPTSFTGTSTVFVLPGLPVPIVRRR